MSWLNALCRHEINHIVHSPGLERTLWLRAAIAFKKIWTVVTKHAVRLPALRPKFAWRFSSSMGKSYSNAGIDGAVIKFTICMIAITAQMMSVAQLLGFHRYLMLLPIAVGQVWKR